MLAGISGTVIVSSCSSGGNNEGIEYAPNMYNSDAYEAYTQREEMELNPNGMTMRAPVKGTIARGQMDYTMYSEGYEESSAWTSSVANTEKNVAEDGQALYMTFCKHCHGKSGKNDGNVIKLSEFPPPPFENFQTEYIQNLPIGKIFHTITFGKGMMGSHASQLSPEERWKVSLYVKSLSLGDAYTYSAEEGVANEPAEAVEPEAAEDNAPEQEATSENHDNHADH